MGRGDGLRGTQMGLEKCLTRTNNPKGRSDGSYRNYLHPQKHESFPGTEMPSPGKRKEVEEEKTGSGSGRKNGVFNRGRKKGAK